MNVFTYCEGKDYKMNINWSRLETFYKVVKAGSITNAAEEMNLTQPSISRQIISLEKSINARLFDRSSGGLHLTKQGKLVFQNVRQMYSFAELTQSQLQEDYIKDKGDLRVGANIGLVDTWLAPLIPEFVNRYPHIDLSIISDDRALDLQTYEVDVALQPFAPTQGQLIQEPLMSWHRKLYASPDYLKKFGTPQTAEDLDSHRLISFGEPSIFLFKDINWHLEIGCKPGALRKPFFCINHIRSLLEIGEKGVGIISFSSESELLKKSSLVPILPNLKGPQIDIYFSYQKSLERIKRIQILKQYLLEKVQKHHKI